MQSDLGSLMQCFCWTGSSCESQVETVTESPGCEEWVTPTQPPFQDSMVVITWAEPRTALPFQLPPTPKIHLFLVCTTHHGSQIATLKQIHQVTITQLPQWFRCFTMERDKEDFIYKPDTLGHLGQGDDSVFSSLSSLTCGSHTSLTGSICCQADRFTVPMWSSYRQT